MAVTRKKYSLIVLCSKIRAICIRRFFQASECGDANYVACLCMCVSLGVCVSVFAFSVCVCLLLCALRGSQQLSSDGRDVPGPKRSDGSKT